MNYSSTDPLGVSPIIIAFRTCFISFLGLLIITGNIFSIVVTRRIPDLADSTKILMTSLAVSDLTVGFLTAFSVVASAMNQWPFGDIACHAYVYITVGASMMSEFSLICLNVERYIAVTRPYKFPIWCTRRRITSSVTVAAIAALSLQFVTSNVLKVSVIYFEGPAVCLYANTSAAFNICILIFVIIIPVLIMMCIYFHIIKISREHEKRINRNDPNNKNHIQDNKALKTFVVVTLTYAVCYTPAVIVRIVVAYTNGESAHWLHFLVTWLVTSNSVCNVFIYCLFNRSYRQKAKQIITNRWLCCRRSVEPVNI